MGDGGEYTRGARFGHRLFIASLNRGVSLGGLEAMRDRAAQAFSDSPAAEQAFYRGFDDTFGVYLDDLRELEEPPTSPTAAGLTQGAARLRPGGRGAQARVSHPDMEAGA